MHHTTFKKHIAVVTAAIACVALCLFYGIERVTETSRSVSPGHPHVLAAHSKSSSKSSPARPPLISSRTRLSGSPAKKRERVPDLAEQNLSLNPTVAPTYLLRDENSADESVDAPSSADPIPEPNPIWPASMVEIPDISLPERIALGIDELATEFTQTLTNGASASSSDEYRKNFLSETQINDIRFKTLYGGRLWHAHHVQAQHTLGPTVKEAEVDQ